MQTIWANHAWYELVGPVALVATVLLCYGYINKVIKSPHFRTTTIQKLYFFIAVTLFFLIKGTPFAVIADHYFFSALILQLSMMAFIIVPLFILSLPEQFVTNFFWHHRRAKIAKAVLKQPWLLAIAFNALISIYLIPSVFNVVHGSTTLQFIYEVLFVVLAFLTWWIILQPSDDVANHSYLKRLIIVFFMAMFLMPIGIFLLVVQDPIYTAYAAASGELWGFLTAVDDQQAAGGILKILQLTSYAFALYDLLKKWGLRDEEQEGHVDENTRVVQGVVIQLNERNKQRQGRKK